MKNTKKNIFSFLVFVVPLLANAIAGGVCSWETAMHAL